MKEQVAQTKCDKMKQSSPSTKEFSKMAMALNCSASKNKVHLMPKFGDEDSGKGSNQELSLLGLVRDLWSDDIAVVKRALTKLAVQCHGDETVEDVRHKIGQIGGPLTIVKAMERLSDDPNIQARGCGALANLAYNDDIQNLIALVGGINIVVLAMTKFPEHSYLQECGCGALRNLAFKNRDNQDLVNKAGGVSAIITAMGTHSGNDRIHSLACSALYNIADGLEESGAVMVSSGGLIATAKAAEDYLDNPEVKEAACNLQKKLLKAILSD